MRLLRRDTRKVGKTLQGPSDLVGGVINPVLPLSGKNWKMELENKTFSTAFCSHVSHFFACFSHFQTAFFHIFSKRIFKTHFTRIFHT